MSKSYWVILKEDKMKAIFSKNFSSLYRVFFLLFFLFLIFPVQAQQIKAEIDRDSLRIGEQLNYKIKVETQASDKVVFPQGQSFLPFEVIDSTAIDTFLKKDTFRLEREYPLTQFDSGAYIIPKQTIIINGEGFYTDSFHVKVKGVVVDTLKQNLYPVKPALNIRSAPIMPDWIWWLLGIIIAGLVIYYFLRKQKRKAGKEELPPYEKAIQTLKILDENQDLELGKMKSFYSGLSNAVKRYIDEKIDGNALESTTQEFIDMLRNYKKDKQIYLKEQVIDSLEAVLKRADLAKFAGIHTDKLTAKEDRITIEENIQAFDKAIPEPTEEELLKNEAYRMEKQRKEKLKKVRLRFALGFLIVLISLSVFTALKGFDYFTQAFNSQSTEKLLKGNWISSEYGKYGITLTTPDVLRREVQDQPEVFPHQSEIEENFSYGNILGNIYIKATNIRIKKDAKLDSIDVEHLLDTALGEIDASMMTFKTEEFITLENKKAQRIFGTFTLGEPGSESQRRKAYTFLVFNERGGIQELLITYDQGDENAEAIEQRVINSVEFNTEYDG